MTTAFHWPASNRPGLQSLWPLGCKAWERATGRNGPTAPVLPIKRKLYHPAPCAASAAWAKVKISTATRKDFACDPTMNRAESAAAAAAVRFLPESRPVMLETRASPRGGGRRRAGRLPAEECARSAQPALISGSPSLVFLDTDRRRRSPWRVHSGPLGRAAGVVPRDSDKRERRGAHRPQIRARGGGTTGEAAKTTS